MSKKSKRSKKPKPREGSILSANEIESYIRLKYVVDDDGFWKWFFSECPCNFGETNLLYINLNIQHIPVEYKNYYNIIIIDFGPDADEEGCLEIENDL